MSEPAHDLRMTVAEFLRWDDGTDTRYELVGGRPVAMAPAKDPHGRIAMNAGVEIDRRLADRPPCCAISEAGIWISDEDYYEADVAATCAPTSEDGYIAEPFLVVEVLSASDARERDGLDKVQNYIALPSVQEIWLIDSRKRWVQQWLRAGEDRWIVTLPLASSASFESPTLSGEPVALDDLYLDTGL
jgi:Uma2 family endonuclease